MCGKLRHERRALVLREESWQHLKNMVNKFTKLSNGSFRRCTLKCYLNNISRTVLGGIYGLTGHSGTLGPVHKTGVFYGRVFTVSYGLVSGGV